MHHSNMLKWHKTEPIRAALDESPLGSSISTAVLCLLYVRQKAQSEKEEFFCQDNDTTELFQTLNSRVMLPIQDHEKYCS